MWIRIKTDEGRRFSILVPLFMLRSPLMWRIAARYSGEGAQYMPAAKEMCAELSRYVKKHGHFVLVDVESAEGEKVKITV